MAGPALPLAQTPAPNAGGALPSGTVTFLFTDIEGSTRLWETYPAAMSAALARHDALLREAITRRNGAVFKTVGDAFCAAFPTVPDAIAATLAAQRALAAEAWGATGPLRVRMALHTEMAEERDGDYFGPPLNRVARLLAVGHGGQILLSQATAELLRDTLPTGTALRDLGEHRLKDLVRPEHIYQLLAPDLPGEFPPLRSLSAFRHNLPIQLTSFVGREREMASVRELLATRHLLTLTGPGGTGKTRLALQVAADLLDTFPDGVWLVDLAALTDPALVPQATATALGVREEPGRALLTTLTDYLRPRRLLLLLDNCEHLIEACAQVATSLLRACPDLRVLATSREALGLAGETAWRVPSLSLPDPAQLPPPESLAQYEAVRLLIERAMAVQPAFAVTPQNAAAVAQICRRLDGIPLAIELAAARSRVLTVEQIAARLDDRFRLLTGGSRTALPRQQTLRALVDWSYDLLAEPERLLWRRLAVFAGGWTLEAAEAVCAGDGIGGDEVLDLLAGLVNKSLVVAEEQDAAARYRLLDTIRQYARDRLLEAGEMAPLRDRHLAYYLELVEKADRRLRGPDQRLWFLRLEAEHDNLRAALDWACDRDPEQELRLAGALGWFWHRRGYLQEGHTRLEQALACAAGSEATGATPARLQALIAWARLAHSQGDYAGARALSEQSLALAHALGDPVGSAWSFYNQALAGGDRALFTQALALFRAAGDRWGMANALIGLGRTAWQMSDHPTALARLEESLALFRAVGDKELTGTVIFYLGSIAGEQQDYAAAQTLLEESLALAREVGDTWGTGLSLFSLGLTAGYQGAVERATALLEESLGIFRAVGARGLVGEALVGLGDIARQQGDMSLARTHFAASLAILRGTDNPWQRIMPLQGLGYVALAEGDAPQAAALFREGLALLSAPEENPVLIAGGLAGLAGAAALQGQAVRAARLFGAASALLAALGAQLSPPDQAAWAQYTAVAQAGLDAGAWEVAGAAGAALTPAQAVAEALADAAPDA